MACARGVRRRVVFVPACDLHCALALCRMLVFFCQLGCASTRRFLVHKLETPMCLFRASCGQTVRVARANSLFVMARVALDFYFGHNFSKLQWATPVATWMTGQVRSVSISAVCQAVTFVHVRGQHEWIRIIPGGGTLRLHQVRICL